jgi:hypothetical protein
VNVIITIDVECWPSSHAGLEAGIDREVAHHIYGQTRSGHDVGIEWQMRLLESHGLRGVFFVEALCAVRGFRRVLSEVVDRIQTRGHDVELHAHTEWFEYSPPQSVITGKYHQHLASYSGEEQRRIICAAREVLELCGARGLVAFRAGNFGANRETPAAVRDAGLMIDSSYNAGSARRTHTMGFSDARVAPFMVDSIWEYPVTCFRDQRELQPHHLRPLQVTAASFREMAAVLQDAMRRGLDTVVILTHSFEMTHFRPGPAPPTKHRLNIYRFGRLCRFLAEHREKFRVTTFKEIVARGMFPARSDQFHEPPRSSTLNYVLRGGQNLAANLLRF